MARARRGRARTTPGRPFCATNARMVTIVEYDPEPAAPVQALMDDIALRLQGRLGGAYPPGPGVPETSFTGYAPAAPNSFIPAAQAGLGGAGQPYPDRNLNTIASGLSGQPYADTSRQMFAERLRRRGAVL